MAECTFAVGFGGRIKLVQMPAPAPEDPSSPPTPSPAEAKPVYVFKPGGRGERNLTSNPEIAKHEPLPGLRRFIPIRVKPTYHGTSVRIAWGQALATFLVLLLGGWITLATAGYVFVRYWRDFPEVKFSHMLFYPLEKENYRRARGDHMITLAQKEIDNKRLREAALLIRIGASLSPENREGRLLLAQFYSGWARSDLAQKLLLDGLKTHASDTEYLKSLLSFLLQRQEDFEVIRIATELLAIEPPSESVNPRATLLALALATARFSRGNYDEAEDTIHRYRLNNALDGKLLAIRIEWERGGRDNALERLQTLSEELPDEEQVYAQFTTYLREADRIDEMRRLAVLRQLSHPNRPRARIDLLYLHDKAKQEAKVQEGIQEILEIFPGDAKALTALADFAANTGRPALAHQIYEDCKAKNLPWEATALMTVEAYLVAREYRAALDASAQLQKDNPEWAKRSESILNALQAIAHYGLSDLDTSQLFLTNFLNKSGVRADNLVAVAKRLITIGAKDQARQVLTQAVRTDPLNQTALVDLIRVEITTGHADSVNSNVRTLLTMRKPPRTVLRDAYNFLASDQFLLTPGRSETLSRLL